MEENKLPVPPFTLDSATQKARYAEGCLEFPRPAQSFARLHTHEPLAQPVYVPMASRPVRVEFLTQKWHKELDYRLCKEIWGFRENRMAVRFVYECHDASGQWWRSFGNELWEFDENGLMRRREASINDLAIAEQERKLRWAIGPRPIDHPGLTGMGL